MRWEWSRMLRLGLQGDVRGMLLKLVEFIIRKTVALLPRNLDDAHLVRYTFFRCVWQSNSAQVC